MNVIASLKIYKLFMANKSTLTYFIRILPNNPENRTFLMV